MSTETIGLGVGNSGGTAQIGDRGIAAIGDGGRAGAGKDAVAVGSNRTHVSVTDGGMAKAGYDSYAEGNLASICMAVDRSYAVAREEGFAIVRGGVAEVELNGFACASSRTPGQGERGIAIAHDHGVAVALNDGSVVRAGVGGVLLGFHGPPKGKRLVVERLDGHPRLQPNSFYVFRGGNFDDPTTAELNQILFDIARWRDIWTSTPARM